MYTHVCLCIYVCIYVCILIDYLLHVGCKVRLFKEYYSDYPNSLIKLVELHSTYYVMNADIWRVTDPKLQIRPVPYELILI